MVEKLIEKKEQNQQSLQFETNKVSSQTQLTYSYFWNLQLCDLPVSS